MRVPLAVKGPGVQTVERSEMVLNNDLMPTVLELAGAQTPAFVDGTSYAPLLRGETPPWRDAFMVEAIRDEHIRRPAFRAVRTEDRMYVDYSTRARELYRLDEDPYQLENVVEESPDERADLSGRLDALRDCGGDGCRAAEGF